jgi:hypothetical protein
MDYAQLEMFEEVVCKECGETLFKEDAFLVQKHTDGEDIEVPFCNEREACDHYIDQLNFCGL